MVTHHLPTARMVDWFVWNLKCQRPIAELACHSSTAASSAVRLFC